MMRNDDPHPPDESRTAGIDPEEVRRRARGLPLRAVAALAARWGLRVEGFLDRLDPGDQAAAERLIRVAVTVACGGEVADRPAAARATVRFHGIALRCTLLAAWRRVGMRWALVRGGADGFSASRTALDDAVARCNVAGALAGLARAALAAEALVTAADSADDFDEELAATKDQLIESALTTAAAVASLAGAEGTGGTVAAVIAADLDRLAARVPRTADWLGFPIDPTSERHLGPLWPGGRGTSGTGAASKGDGRPS